MVVLSACGKTANTTVDANNIGNTEKTKSVEAITNNTTNNPEELDEEVVDTNTEPVDYSKIKIDKYIKIKDYEKIIEVTDFSTTDEEVDEQLESIVKSLTTDFEKKYEGTIEDNSSLNISYEITVDGEVIMSIPDLDIVIGAEYIMPGVDEKMVGKKVGDSFTVSASYPHDYQDINLAGKKADVDITINYILANGKQATLNDDFADAFSSGEYKTLKELKEAMKETISKSKKDGFANSLIEKILENTEIKKDISEFEEIEYRVSLDSCVELIGTQGTTMKELASMYSLNSVSEFKQYLKESASRTVKEKMVIYKFAKMFKLEVTDEEYEAYVNELLKFHPQETIDVSYPEDESRYLLLYDKVIDKLIELQ